MPKFDIVINNKVPVLEGQRLAARGVPPHLFSSRIQLDCYVADTGYTPPRGKPVVVDAKQQLLSFLKLQDSILDASPVIVIASQFDMRLAQAVALGLFRSAFYEQDALTFQSNQDLPLWYRVTGAKWDHLRDDRAYRETMAKICFLVIDHLPNSTVTDLTQKVRDHLYTFNHIPRLVLVGGNDPYEVARKTLFINPNYVLYLSDKVDQR